jgi:hypothetical protein
MEAGLSLDIIEVIDVLCDVLDDDEIPKMFGCTRKSTLLLRLIDEKHFDGSMYADLDLGLRNSSSDSTSVSVSDSDPLSTVML